MQPNEDIDFEHDKTLVEEESKEADRMLSVARLMFYIDSQSLPRMRLPWVLTIFIAKVINTLNGSAACLGVAMAKETTEDKVKQLEEEIITLKMHVAAKDRGLEEEKKAIVDYMEKEFATHKLVINEIVGRKQSLHLKDSTYNSCMREPRPSLRASETELTR